MKQEFCCAQATRMKHQEPKGCVLETAFHLDSVEPTSDPSGGNATWFCYTISQGPDRTNIISGATSGSLNEVHLQLAEMVRGLNEKVSRR
jgi:hypothetical protein